MAIDLKKLISPSKFIPFYTARVDKICSDEFLPPVAVELHWTSECNYDCIHCSYGSRRQSKGRLTSEQIKNIITDLTAMNVSAAYISGGGEPTVLKGWEEYAQLLINGGVEVALITNGVALSHRNVEILRRMNYIAVSVYSTIEEEYVQITDSRFFDRQWSTPKLVKASNTQTIVGARCVLNNINYKSLCSIHKRTIEAGYDYLIFIPAVDYEGRGVGLSMQATSELLEDISKNHNEFNPSYTNALDLLSRNISHYVPTDYRTRFSKPPLSCSAINIGANAFINYCGGVWLCQPHIGDLQYCIGNIHENSFVDIWGSLQHMTVVERLNKNFADGKCKNCRSILFNQTADDFLHKSVKFDTNSHLDPFI